MFYLLIDKKWIIYWSIIYACYNWAVWPINQEPQSEQDRASAKNLNVPKSDSFSPNFFKKQEIQVHEVSSSFYSVPSNQNSNFSPYSSSSKNKIIIENQNVLQELAVEAIGSEKYVTKPFKVSNNKYKSATSHHENQQNQNHIEYNVVLDSNLIKNENYIDHLAKKFNCQNYGQVFNKNDDAAKKSTLKEYRFVYNNRERIKNQTERKTNTRGSKVFDIFSANNYLKFNQNAEDARFRRLQPLHLPTAIRKISRLDNRKRVLRIPPKLSEIEFEEMMMEKKSRKNERIEKELTDYHQAPATSETNQLNDQVKVTITPKRKSDEPPSKLINYIKLNNYYSKTKDHPRLVNPIITDDDDEPEIEPRSLKTNNSKIIRPETPNIQNSNLNISTRSLKWYEFLNPVNWFRKSNNKNENNQSYIRINDKSKSTTYKNTAPKRLQPSIVSSYFSKEEIYKYVPPPPNFNDHMFNISIWYFKLLNITGAWDQGYSGRGVTVTVLDDGIEFTHPDLDFNYNPSASFDVNDNDDSPLPRYTRDNTNKHGTRCAGVIAAEANNSICIPGIAYNAKIGGIRMLDGVVNDNVEAQSISFQRNVIDIYSSSWGPDDDGKTVDGPGHATKRAFELGVKHGRNKLGNIFVWASGNGGRWEDSCSVDGYANSIYTISISSASESGAIPWYNEKCTSTLVTAYSSNSNNKDPKIATTDIRGKCTDQHTGTSAAAPMVAGIIALALEANPRLTWRDVQHLLIRTSSHQNLLANDWEINGAGRQYSHYFGYGVINAGKFVEMAKNLRPEDQVGTQRFCEVNLLPRRSVRISSSDRISIATLFSECTDNGGQEITSLEHVILKTQLSFSRRGDIEIELISPSKTISKIHQRRPLDDQNIAFDNWPFMSVHFWDESPYGEWRVNIENGGDSRARGVVHTLKLQFYGTFSDRTREGRTPKGPKQRTENSNRNVSNPSITQLHERENHLNFLDQQNSPQTHLNLGSKSVFKFNSSFVLAVSVLFCYLYR